MKQLLLLIGICLSLILPVTTYAEEITIVGTGSGPPILKAVGLAFTKENPDVKIIVPPSIGSGGAIRSVGNDDYIIGRVAREIKPSEQHYKLIYVPIARVPIVFYTNKTVKIHNLTNGNICDIYSGKVFTWQQLGGSNARIRVIRRQDGDSSLSVLRQSFPNFHDLAITKFSKTTHSDPDTINLTEETADAIAFGSYSDVKNRNVSVLNIDNVSPADAAYPYYGNFALIFKEKNRTGNIKKFIDFATSPAASAAILRGGGLPINKGE